MMWRSMAGLRRGDCCGWAARLTLGRKRREVQILKRGLGRFEGRPRGCCADNAHLMASAVQPRRDDLVPLPHLGDVALVDDTAPDAALQRGPQLLRGT